MLPVAAVMLLVLRYRSNPIAGGRGAFRTVLAALLVQCGLALIVTMQLKGVIGTPYEILTGKMLEGESEIAREQLYPLSVINQAGLFFKYMGLWVFPAPNSMSVDIRPVFPLDFTDWKLWAGVVAFVTYIVGALGLLLRGGPRGLFGLSLLLPAVLFCTEFASVRLQEPFVLYRSYLWAFPLFIGLAVGLRRLRVRVLLVFLLLCVPVFTGMSWMRLKTFSHPVLVWREAADIYEVNPRQSGVFGGYRIYYNLGTELREWGKLQLALDAFNRAVELKPSFGWAWNNRGAVYLSNHDYSAAEADYRKATQLMPEQHLSWRGLAMALEAQGKRREAEQALQKVCELAGPLACRQLKPVDLLRRE